MIIYDKLTSNIGNYLGRFMFYGFHTNFLKKCAFLLSLAYYHSLSLKLLLYHLLILNKTAVKISRNDLVFKRRLFTVGWLYPHEAEHKGPAKRVIPVFW
jgi:hypothetical protein